MGALPTGVTQEGFYGDDTLHGNYQYVTIKNIVNNFQLTKVGDANHIQFINRDIIIYHAKRGLQELNYDVLTEIKGIEIDLSDNLTLTLPEDYLKYVRVSWVDVNGQFHPMVSNNDTLIADAYLQDNDYAILFDAQGAVLKASQNSYDQTLVGGDLSGYTYYAGDYREGYDNSFDGALGGRFGMQTDKANGNGWFTVDKRSGVMKFSSNVGTKTIVMEYISDGLEYADIADIKVNKFAVDALMKYIEAEILGDLSGVTEYVVKRKKINYEELLQVLRGRDKTIK
jgi:hypothetical protein